MTEPQPLPEGVQPDELYDGPAEKVVPLRFTEAAQLVAPIPQTPQAVVPQPKPTIPDGYPAVLTAALDVLSARLLGLLAVVAACAMWSFAVWDPSTMRTVAASLFSLTVLMPLIVLYWKAG